jgi:hypothetical protein
MDGRDRKAVGLLGLPQDADEFAELACDHWDKLGRIGLDDRKRRAFITTGTCGRSGVAEQNRYGVIGSLQSLFTGSDLLKYRCAVRNNSWIK